MENYTKGANREEILQKNTIPIPNLPDDFEWLVVKGGTKMTSILQVAVDFMKQDKVLVWSGSGPAINKVISCVEIVKRNFKDVHQFNKLCYLKVTEEWEPKLDGLDKIAVKRDVPTIHIVLSKTPINSDLPGYQRPEKDTRKISNKPKKPHNSQTRQRHIDPQEFSNIGLRSANYREKRKFRTET